MSDALEASRKQKIHNLHAHRRGNTLTLSLLLSFC
jgi:hypothetical protein